MSISKILRIENLCGRIDSMHVNGDGVMLRSSFVYILRVPPGVDFDVLSQLSRFQHLWLRPPMGVNL